MDSKIFKAKNRESGVLSATLLEATVNSASVTPTPNYAPGVIVLRPGTAFEEHIYYKTKDSGAGTISGLTRDYTNLNGGTGFEHTNGSAWETLQASEYLNNIVDAIIEGYQQEQMTTAYVSTTSFTVLGDVTAFYTAGRILRANQDNTKILIVASSSYSGGSGLTTIVTNYGTVPNPITHMEIGIMPKAATNLIALISGIQGASYIYAADSGGSDAYAITLSPAPTAYATGQVLLFKANTINTGAATLNVNGLGAKTIVKNFNQTLADGDIQAGQFVAVQYDGTDLQMLSQLGNSVINIDGWVPYSTVVPTRTTADDPTYVITFAGVDLTGGMSVGMKVKWIQNGTTRYGIITEIAFSTNTTMTIYGGTDYDVDDTASFAISGFNYSRVRVPHGFPMNPLKWTVEITDANIQTQAGPASGTWYNLGGAATQIVIPIGSWSVTMKCLAQGAVTNGGSVKATLSTANNTESDPYFTRADEASGSTAYRPTVAAWAERNLLLASKTTYYLNCCMLNASAELWLRGDIERTWVNAVCNYL
jgi:hypothetical protein